MKHRMSFILSIVLLLALIAAGARAQEQGQEQKEVETKIDLEVSLRNVKAQFGFETKVVKGAPYSAIAEAETIQTLADGNRITNKTKTAVYRDSEGRTRRENLTKAQQGITEVFISNPATGTNYSFEKSGSAEGISDSSKPVKRISNKSNVSIMSVESAGIKRVHENEKLAEYYDRSTSSDEPLPKKKRAPVESLGKQVIEGVECEGTRSTLTIPAGKIGNDLPINIVTEEWYSPELQVLVLTKHSDPRSGETTYRLTNINRTEPDRTLFEVPDDQAEIKMKLKNKAKMKGQPEEEH